MTDCRDARKTAGQARPTLHDQGLQVVAVQSMACLAPMGLPEAAWLVLGQHPGAHQDAGACPAPSAGAARSRVPEYSVARPVVFMNHRGRD